MTSNSKDKAYFVRLNYVLMPRASTLLRKMFRTKHLDAFGMAWLDTAEQGKTFTDNIGKTIYTSASRRQKRLLRSGRVDLWDLQLLRNILLKLNFGRRVDENAMDKLAKMHAQVRACADHALSREQFATTWEKLKGILIRLGDPVSELETLDESTDVDDVRHEYTAPPPSDEIDEKADEFYRSANECHKKGDLHDAISRYNRCINLYASSRKLAAVYSHRSAAYLGLDDEICILSDDANGKLARDDAKNAVELWPTSYEAHYRLGRAYEHLWNDRKARKHYEIASVLNPGKTSVRRRLERLKLDANSSANDEFDIDSSAQFLESSKSIFARLGESYWTVWKGLCHLGGHNFEKDEKTAAILVSQAAECGNAYAMLVLANMYVGGVGVEKNAEKYVELLTKVARLQLDADGRRNKYVATAEHNLGVAYRKGIGVSKDLERAIGCYKMAAGRGFAMAAYNLGCLYAGGSGVEKDEEKAVEYWMMAARGKLPLAFRRLCDYYCHTDLDPDRALEWYKMALGYEQDGTDAHFENRLVLLKELCRMSEIIEWENRMGLSIDGYSIRERKYRYIRDKIPILNYCEKDESLTELDLPVEARKALNSYSYAFTCVLESDIDERLQRAVIRFGRAVWCLREINEAGKKFEFIRELARCLETELIVTHWDPPDRRLAARIIDESWNDVLKYRWVNRTFDRDARICYAYFHRRDEPLHRDCVQKYPDVAYFRRMLVGAMVDHDAGLREAEVALGEFEKDWDLMFEKARHLAGLGRSPNRMVGALREFVSAAPPYHWLVPGAYYVMALMYVRPTPELSGETEQLATEYFRLGMSAEANQLPCLVKHRNGRLEKLFELTLEKKLGRKKAVSVKNKLVEPSRVELIKLHRRRVRENGADGYVGKSVRFEMEKNVFLLLTLRFIDLNEIDGVRDHVYEGKAVSVRIVEDLFVFGGINLLVEDRNGDVRSVRIIDAAAQDRRMYAYGARIIIRNPDVRMGMDARQIIWVRDAGGVIFVSGGNLKVCRFCRNKNDKGMCAKCLKAYYCCKQCQVSDWKVMKHKLICF